MLNRLMLGMRVEVRSNEDRYRSAWLEGVIMAAYVTPGRGRRYKIRYDPDNCELLTHNRQPLTEEDVSATQVRPIPSSFLEKHSYCVGDVVEVYDNGCWWLGTLIQVLHAGKYFLIHNPHTGHYNKFYPSKLRHAQQWCKGRWSLLSSQQNIWTCLFAVVMMILSRNYLWLFGLKCELNFDPKNLKQEPTKIWKRNPALVRVDFRCVLQLGLCLLEELMQALQLERSMG